MTRHDLASPAPTAALTPTPVTYSEHDGVRLLHFAGAEHCAQGAILLSEPDRLLLPYAQQMMAWLLFLDPAQLADAHVAQLGLGPGSLTRAARFTCLTMTTGCRCWRKTRWTG